MLYTCTTGIAKCCYCRFHVRKYFSMAFEKCRVAGVSYVLGQSEYTYITGSSYRTVLDPKYELIEFPQTEFLLKPFLVPVEQ